MVSTEHGNFIVNLGGASACEVMELLEIIKERVEVPLESEWQLWGFEESGETSGKETACAAPSC